MFYLSLVRQALIWPSVHNRYHLKNIKIAIVLKKYIIILWVQEKQIKFLFFGISKNTFLLKWQCAMRIDTLGLYSLYANWMEPSLYGPALGQNIFIIHQQAYNLHTVCISDNQMWVMKRI